MDEKQKAIEKMAKFLFDNVWDYSDVKGYIDYKKLAEALANAGYGDLRKFAEALKTEVKNTPNANEFFIKAWCDKIDEKLNEFLGGEK